MVKHIILWQLKDELSEEKKLEVLKNAKVNLEGLLGKIDGLTEIKLQEAKRKYHNYGQNCVNVKRNGTHKYH